jgi:hypothetical protein
LVYTIQLVTSSSLMLMSMLPASLVPYIHHLCCIDVGSFKAFRKAVKIGGGSTSTEISN